MNTDVSPRMLAQNRVCRCAFTLLEASVCTVTLAAVAAGVMHMVGGLRRCDRDSLRQFEAQAALENALADLTALPWEELDKSAAARIAVPPEISERWPQAQLSAAIVSETQPSAKRVTVRINFANESRSRSHALTAWVFEPLGDAL